MGMNYYVVKKKPTILEPLHIGKASAGWKFLFHEVSYAPFDYSLQLNTYNQWKDWLEENTGPDKEFIILNENDEEITVKELFKIIDEKQKEENKDDFVYAKNIDGYRFSSGDFS